MNYVCEHSAQQQWSQSLRLRASHSGQFLYRQANPKLNFKNWLKSKQYTILTSKNHIPTPPLDMELRKWPAWWWAKKVLLKEETVFQELTLSRGQVLITWPTWHHSHPVSPRQSWKAGTDIPLMASCAKYLTSISSSWPSFCSTGLTSSCKALKSNSIICEGQSSEPEKCVMVCNIYYTLW